MSGWLIYVLGLPLGLGISLVATAWELWSFAPQERGRMIVTFTLLWPIAAVWGLVALVMAAFIVAAAWIGGLADALLPMQDLDRKTPRKLPPSYRPPPPPAPPEPRR